MTSVRRRGWVSAGVASALAIAVFAAPARADDIWVAPTAQQDFGGLGIGSNGIWPATAVGAVRLAWSVPDNYQYFKYAKLVLIPHVGGQGLVQLFVCPAQSSSLVVGPDCIAAPGVAYAGPANRLLEVDISGFIGPSVGGAGTGYMAVLAYTTPNTATDHIVGLRFDASGFGALDSNTAGARNVAVGSLALVNSRTGTSNVAAGAVAGFRNGSGSNNICLGADADAAFLGESNSIYLGVQGTHTRTTIAGIRGITTFAADAIPVVIDSIGQLGTVSSSIRFKEDIHDMADVSQRLMMLRPVTFRYTQAYRDGAKPIQYGLIAEEVAEVFPELAVRSADGQVETVHYETLNVLLLNEFQKQAGRLEVLEQQLAELLREREVGR